LACMVAGLTAGAFTHQDERGLLFIDNEEAGPASPEVFALGEAPTIEFANGAYTLIREPFQYARVHLRASVAKVQTSWLHQTNLKGQMEGALAWASKLQGAAHLGRTACNPSRRLKAGQHHLAELFNPFLLIRMRR